MKRVLAITTNLEQASFRLRIQALSAPLAAAGFALEVRVHPRGLLGRWTLARSASDYHAVILQRKLLDPAEALHLRRHARRIFYDVDDAVMFHARRVGAWSRWRTRRRLRATVRVVDLVVAGNAYLAGLFREEGCEAVILPTTVDPGSYQVKAHRPTASPRLVWIGSHSTLPYLRQFLPALEEAARRVAGLSLVTISDRGLESTSLPVEHVPWSLAGEAEALALGDVGIAPTPETRWTLGKSGFKIVQYMAAGLPVIASPVGANADLVRPGRTGLLPARAGDWPAAIEELATSAELRAGMGRAGRRLVEEEFCLKKAAERWAALLQD